MKIGYVLKKFPRLSETFVLNEILELERAGVSAHVFSLTDAAASEPSGIRHALLERLAAPVTYLPDRRLLKRWRQWASREAGDLSVHHLRAACLASLVQLEGVSHLHAHFASDAATVACLASRLSGIPFSFTAHAKDVYHQDVDPTLLVRKLHEASFVVTVSEYNRRHLQRLAPRANVVRIYNGVDLDRFRFDPAAPRESDLILAVGRLVAKKGFRDLVRAGRLLADRGRPFRCRILGAGAEHDALAAEIRALGLEDRVTLVGAAPVEAVVAELGQATVFALPCVVTAEGDRDGLPTVLLEALATGLPVVSTTVSGIPEIVGNGSSGLLVPPGDVPALAGALERLLADADLRGRLARAGRARAERSFDLRRNVPALHALFLQASPAARVEAGAG